MGADAADLELRLLRALTLVVDTGSFTAAAATLGVSQPALSQQVRRLEAVVGTPLLVRSGRGMRLTSAGEALVDAGRPVLVAATRALARARGAAEGPCGLRVGFVAGTPQLLLNLVLEAGDAGWGPVTLRRTEWADEAESLLAGHCDVAFVQLPVPGAGLVQVPLAVQDRVAVFPRCHPLGDRSEVSIADLADEPILDAATGRAFWLVDPRPDGRPPRAVGPPAATVEEMLASVAAGRGMALTSRSVAEGHWRRDLCFVPVTDIPPVTVGAAWPLDGHRPAVPGLVEHLQLVLASADPPPGVTFAPAVALPVC